jgi:hypothetical protein
MANHKEGFIMDNKFLLLYAVFSGLLLSYILNNSFPLDYKIRFLFISGLYMILLILFESELDKKNEKEKKKNGGPKGMLLCYGD